MVYLYFMMTVVKNKDMEMRIRSIDPELHRLFRILCAMESKSQNRKMQELIEEAVKKAGLTEDKPKMV